MLLLSSAGLFSKLPLSKYSFRNTIRVSNGFDPDQDCRSVGPDLGPNCLQKISADDKSRRFNVVTDNENIKHLTCKINNHSMPYLITYPDEQNALVVKLRIFPYLSILTFVLGAQKNHLIETVLLSTHNICFG